MKPHPKVVVGTLAAALSVVLVWGLQSFSGINVPPEIASAFTTIIGAAAGYLMPGD